MEYKNKSYPITVKTTTISEPNEDSATSLYILNTFF